MLPPPPLLLLAGAKGLGRRELLLWFQMLPLTLLPLTLLPLALPTLRWSCHCHCLVPTYELSKFLIITYSM